MKEFNKFSRYLSIIRIIAGFIFAPILGTFLYFLAVSFPSPLSFDGLLSAVSDSIVYFFSVSSSTGPLFYPLVMVLGTLVLLLLMRYFSCNISICILGALTNGILASVLFLIMLLLSGASFMPAFAGFALLLSMITVPSILAGVLFWFIAAFKNTFVMTDLQMNHS